MKKHSIYFILFLLLGGIIYLTINSAVLSRVSSDAELYKIAKENGYIGTKEEWVKELSFISCNKCTNGIDGKNGINGEDGVNGINGGNGSKGNDGANGSDGTNGINGTNGIDGYTPVKGVDYFDGLDGANGTNGSNGTNGYTPVKGVDYFDGEDGVSGTVSTSTATDITGILKGNGATIAQAIAGVDYLTPGDVPSNYLKLDASNGPITGNLLIKPGTDSASNFEVQDKDSNTVLSVNTSTNRVGIGTSSPSSTFDLLGTARFGDHTTNYSEFEADGTLKMVGTATTWEDLRVQILTRTGGSASPTYTSGFGGNATLYTYNFSKSATNSLYFEVQLPHSWSGTVIFPHVHFAPVGIQTGNVRWILEYTWVNINGTFGQSQVYYMDYNIGGASQWKHLMASNDTGITPAEDQDNISSMLICRLYRVGGVSPDTLDSNAALVAFDIHFEMDTIGSRTHTAK